MEKMFYLTESLYDSWTESMNVSIVMQSPDISVLQKKLHELYESSVADDDNEIVNGIYNPNGWAGDAYERQCWDADSYLDDEDDERNKPRSVLWPPAERKDNLSLFHCTYQIIPQE